MKRIMVVDDSETVLLSLRTVLVKSGFAVDVARDAQDALDQIAAGARPDAIISDMNMPGLDGVAFARSLRALPETRTTPLLILSVISEKAKRLEAKSAGATGWLVKPVLADQLLDVLGRVLPAG